jgi:FKBP-type peptidyl-prolyl cis-trans isomerase
MCGKLRVRQATRSLWWAGLLNLLLLSAVARAQTGPATADSLLAPASSLSTPGGVRYVVMQAGSGLPLPPHARVAVRYRGYLPTGHLFDSSPSGRPLRFRVGRAEVIPGWDELLPLLPVGTRVRAWIPARLAYGSRGVLAPDDSYLIPPNTDLIFNLELLSAR